jgi:Ni/Co efflux regulator RcnB
MKRMMTSAIVLALLGSGAALAQSQPGMQYRGVPYNRGDQERSAQSQAAGGGAQSQRGDRGGAQPDRGGQADRGGQDRGGRGQDRPQQQQPQAQPQQQPQQQPQRDRGGRGGQDQRGPDRNDNRGPDRNDNRGPDNRGPDRNDNGNRPGMQYRGVPYNNQNRPPVGRPNDPRYNNQRDRNRPQYDARRYRPSYRSPQRYRAPAWRPPIGYYAYNWRFGDYLPGSWFGSSYYLNWVAYGLPMPPIGCEWVRVGDDALLVDRFNGRVLSVYYDLFW